MATDKVRKYVLPNIPYLFIGWFCLKIGTAYRLAAGTGFGEKLLGLGQTIGAAFASFAPGLAPLDWFVGIVGAVGFRLLIYCKAKKAKKFRRDAEYGTARWGNEKDIKPFVDPKFENNMLLTATERLTMNTRPKNPANARNLNFCGIGSSGSGKTRFWLTPQLLQAHSSYVVVDPKGGVLGQVGAFLQRRGYQIKVFNSIDFSKSMHYNPLSYIRNEADILKFVNALITNTKGEGKEGDPFWTKAETLLYCALIAYIIFVTAMPPVLLYGSSAGRMAFVSRFCAPAMFSPTVLPVTVGRLVSSRPSPASCAMTAGTPPAAYRSSICVGPAGARWQKLGTFALISLKVSRLIGTSASLAMASRCKTLLELQPSAISVASAFLNAAGVRISRGRTPSRTRSMIRIPACFASCVRAAYTAVPCISELFTTMETLFRM